MISAVERLRRWFATPNDGFPFDLSELAKPDSGVEALFRTSFNAPPPDFPLHFVAKDRAGVVRGYVHYTRQEPGVYLCGGLCVDAQAYRHMSAEDRRAIREVGSLSRWLLRESIASLPSTQAVFAYTGDVMSLRDCLALGFEETTHRFLIVKWLGTPLADRPALVGRIAALGAF